jgi:hypothetical protein
MLPPHPRFNHLLCPKSTSHGWCTSRLCRLHLRRTSLAAHAFHASAHRRMCTSSARALVRTPSVARGQAPPVCTGIRITPDLVSSSLADLVRRFFPPRLRKRNLPARSLPKIDHQIRCPIPPSLGRSMRTAPFVSGFVRASNLRPLPVCAQTGRVRNAPGRTVLSAG